MVVGVEVAVGGVTGIAGLRRPHPVADLQVAAERDDVGVADRPAQRGVAVQRRAVDHEVADTRCGVIDFHAGRVRALRRPDARRRVREPLLGVGQTLAQRELAQPRIEQRLERMRQRAAEQFDGVGVDQLAQQRAAAVPPQRRELVERRGRPRRAREYRTPATVPAASSPPAPAAASWPASGACPDRQYGSSSCAVTTGVMPSVSRCDGLRRPACAAPASAAGRPPTTTGRAIPRRPATGRDGPATADGCAGRG